MTINSRMWGVGWYRQSGLPSIPGRTPRLKAIYLLQIAAEVEHALMVQYLYAAYSLDETFNQADGSETTQIVDRWRRDLRLIARQEMAHFVTVQNLLISLGAEVYVNRENNFSDHPDAYPFPVRFEMFGLESLARYVATEAPSKEEIESQETKRRLDKVLSVADHNAKAKINRVGALYTALYWLFLESDESSGPWDMPESVKRRMIDSDLAGVHIENFDFVPKTEYEEFAAKPLEWGVYESSLHVGDVDPRSRALKAIHWIMIQGEGESGADCANVDSHFCRFLGMYDELESSPSLSRAARKVPLNPVIKDSHRSEPVAPLADFITYPESVLWARLFNTRYQMLLLDILLGLSTSRNRDPGLREQLLTWGARWEMEFLKQIGQLLPSLPRHKGSKYLKAGAPFETVQFPADNSKRWDQQRVLMVGSFELVRRLKSSMRPHDQRFAILQAIHDFDIERRASVTERATASRDYVWKEGNRRAVR